MFLHEIQMKSIYWFIYHHNH